VGPRAVLDMVRCGITHKDTKYRDKCSNKETKTTHKQNNKTINKYFFQNTVKITQKRV
jgi:hypothetical protein